MDISAFYELRNRLYCSAAAGCSIINEDFRLKRAIENFQPLSQLNKVFNKLYIICERLFESENVASQLADCIALADAIAVTQGTYIYLEETKESENIIDVKPVELHYSEYSKILNMIKNSSLHSGLRNMAEKENTFMSDPRLLSSFISKINSNINSTYFDEFVMAMTKIHGKNLIPILKNSIDFLNPKSNGEQVKYVSNIVGYEENEWYKELALNENNPSDIRVQAIYALSCSDKNTDLLIELYHTQKGKIKNATITSLAMISPPEAEFIWHKMTDKPEKFKKGHSKYISLSNSKICSDFAVKYINDEIDKILKMNSNEYKSSNIYIADDIQMLANKTGDDVEQCIIRIIDFIEISKSITYKETMKKSMINDITDILIQNLLNHSESEYHDIIRNLYAKNPEIFFKAKFFLDLYENPETAFKNLDKSNLKQRIVIADVLRNIWYSHADKKYYINWSAKFSDYRVKSLPIFKSIPDSVLKFLSDTSFIKKSSIDKLAESIGKNNIEEACTEVCYTFNRILKNHICSLDDTERVKKYAADFIFSTIHYFPNMWGVYVLSDYINNESPEKYKDIVYSCVKKFIKDKVYDINFCIGYLNNFPLSNEDKIFELEKIKKYSESQYKNIQNKKFLFAYIDNFILNLKKGND